MGSFVLKTSMLVVIVALCVPIVNAGIVNWGSLTSPTTADLYSVFMVSTDDGWAVGDAGTILHWNGTEWSSVASPTTKTLFSVSMVNASDGWAVGEHGTVIHWDGTEWSNVMSPTTQSLTSVFLVSASDGLAVGNGGCLLHWNGTKWNNVTSPVGSDLNSVYMTNTNDGWAVGYNSTVLHWNGTAWSIVLYFVELPGSMVLDDKLYSVFMLNATDGWIVGEATYIWKRIYPRILRWNGTQWNNVHILQSPEGTLFSIFMVNADDGWAVGSIKKEGGDCMLHWDGNEWSSRYREGSRRDVFMVSADDGWVVGLDGLIMWWSGTEWIPEFPTAILMLLCLIGSVTIALGFMKPEKETTQTKERDSSEG